MKARKTTYALLVFAMLSIMLLSITPQHTQGTIKRENSTFIISSWDYPDDHGQGIDRIDIYSNETGSWVDTGFDFDYDGSNLVEFNATDNIAIRLSVWSFFNSSWFGDMDNITGRNYQRHNITVVNNNGTEVFSQQNFTYTTVNTFLYAPLFHYAYYVDLDFILEMGEIYLIDLRYELYYAGGL